MSAFKKIVIGSFVLQCWLTTIGSVALILVLLELFGSERAQFTLELIQKVAGSGFFFSSSTAAIVTLLAIAVGTFFLQLFLEKYLFRLMVIVGLAAALVWIVIVLGPHVL